MRYEEDEPSVISGAGDRKMAGLTDLLASALKVVPRKAGACGVGLRARQP